MEVLILTGACGVGKTTIAKEWAKLKNGAIVESDYFTEWIFKPDFPHWTVEEEKFTAELSATIAGKYLENEMPVAIDNVWTPTGIEILRDCLIGQPMLTSIKVVWLFGELEENHRRDRLRIPENQMKARVDIVNKELKEYSWPEYICKIDSTDLSIEQTLAIIENSHTVNKPSKKDS